MPKLRSAGYCNLKLLLIYLVIYGHWIEPDIGSSPVLLEQYRWIYLLHMPLFAFLSGLFLRSEKDCLRQIKRLLPVYLLCQLLCSLVFNGRVDFQTPWWHLWYLLSNCFWAGIGWLWFRFCRGRGKLPILVASVLLGVVAGHILWLDRFLSGSRTVVFLPYFLAGLFLSPDILWQKYRVLGLAALAIAVSVMLQWGKRVGVTFLYHATPFGIMKNGPQLRLLCYALGFLLGFFALTAVPDRRFPFTRAGADTMPVYLIHGPVVRCLRELGLHWGMCAVCAAALIWLVYKLLQWKSPLYGIVPGERRGRRCPVFKKSTSSTQNPSTGSCCP